MKTSFIIPVYNVENYIDQCITSILNQTCPDFEILLIDDGSPDNCPAICEEWTRKDSRIEAFHKENGGLSDARNFGLTRAKGEFIVFIDGDDFWLNKNDLEKLVTLSVNHPNVDWFGFNCCYYYPKSDKITRWPAFPQSLLTETDKNTAICSLVESGTIPMSACLKFIKRDFLINNHLFFVEGQISEDVPWFINLLENTNRCLFADYYVYGYRQNVPGSITKKGGMKSFNSVLDIVKTELAKLENRSFSEEAKDAIRSFMAYEYCILLSSDFNKGGIYKELSGYSNLLKYTLNPKVKKTSTVYSLFGLRITILLLRLYQIIRTSRS